MALTSCYIHGISFSPVDLVTSEYTTPALIIGILFIVTFNMIAFSTQKIGIAITTVANKMSMIIPVLVGLYLFNEKQSLLKFLGVFLAILAIYFSSTSAGKLSFNKKYLLF